MTEKKPELPIKGTPEWRADVFNKIYHGKKKYVLLTYKWEGYETIHRGDDIVIYDEKNDIEFWVKRDGNLRAIVKGDPEGAIVMKSPDEINNFLPQLNEALEKIESKVTKAEEDELGGMTVDTTAAEEQPETKPVQNKRKKIKDLVKKAVNGNW